MTLGELAQFSTILSAFFSFLTLIGVSVVGYRIFIKINNQSNNSGLNINGDNNYVEGVRISGKAETIYEGE